MSFKFQKLNIPDIILIKPKLFWDERGFFMETFKESEFVNNGIKEVFVQDNHSKSSTNVLRGLHFQKEPHAQAKIVRVISGSIVDVAVDIRKGSPYFGKYVSMKLSSENKEMIYIPVGFAHGFLTLEDNTQVLYKTSKEYNKENENGLLWNDKDVNIKWGCDNPIVSKKDKNWPKLKDLNSNFKYRGEK